MERFKLKGRDWLIVLLDTALSGASTDRGTIARMRELAEKNTEYARKALEE